MVVERSGGITEWIGMARDGEVGPGDAGPSADGGRGAGEPRSSRSHIYARAARPEPPTRIDQAGDEWPDLTIWVEVEGFWWPTIGGRWHACPRCDRPLTHREFMAGSSGICATCRPDLMGPYVPRKRTKKKEKS